LNKLFYVLSWITILASMSLILYCGFNILYPYPTICVKSPAPVLNSTVHPGETLQVVVDYAKYTDKPCTVSRQFIDDIVYTLPDYVSNYETGSHKKISYSTKVPESLPPGIYYVKVTLVYEFPPFRTITYTYNTGKFTVTRGDEDCQ
jgi:hypothetical protein